MLKWMGKEIFTIYAQIFCKDTNQPLANNEVPDEMGPFHQGLHCLQLRDRNTSFYKKFDWQPLKIPKGLFHTYCISIYGIIHQNEKDSPVCQDKNSLQRQKCILL